MTKKNKKTNNNNKLILNLSKSKKIILIKQKNLTKFKNQKNY